MQVADLHSRKNVPPAIGQKSEFVVHVWFAGWVLPTKSIIWWAGSPYGESLITSHGTLRAIRFIRPFRILPGPIS